MNCFDWQDLLAAAIVGAHIPMIAKALRERFGERR